MRPRSQSATCLRSQSDALIRAQGNYSAALAPWAGPGHWHDPDMLTIGVDGISLDAMRSNMAIWCWCMRVYATPLPLAR